MGRKDVIVPLEIEDGELLVRAVSLPSCLDSENRATHLAFHLRINEEDLSLSRLLYEKLLSFIKRSTRLIFTFLTPKDIPAGVVELNAGKVRSLDKHIVLKATPNRKNPAHASIYFKKDDGSNYKATADITTDPVDELILTVMSYGHYR